jgi:hypothetical protein
MNLPTGCAGARNGRCNTLLFKRIDKPGALRGRTFSLKMKWCVVCPTAPHIVRTPLLNQLIRLVYASRSVVEPSAHHQGMDPGIARILAKSRKNNARLDVVGGLLFGDGYFLQCLEGDASVVQTLYNRIETDSRHRDVTVLLQSSIGTRTFGAWSMKYVPGEQRLQELLRQWGVSQFDPYQLSKDQLDAAVRFIRDEDDAVDTIPGELHALVDEPAPVAKALAKPALPSKAVPRHPVRAAKAPGAPGNKAFMAVVAGLALMCLIALVFVMLS